MERPAGTTDDDSNDSRGLVGATNGADTQRLEET